MQLTSHPTLCVCTPLLSDIPDDEAQYWTGKLDCINTMRIYDEVRPTLHAKALFHQEHACQKCSNKFYLFIFQAVRGKVLSKIPHLCLHIVKFPVQCG